jgi:hypothetical protein
MRSPTAARVLAAAAVAVSCCTPTAHAESPYRLVQEPAAGYSQIVDVIGTAQQSVRMTMYELADPNALQALIAARP